MDREAESILIAHKKYCIDKRKAWLYCLISFILGIVLGMILLQIIYGIQVWGILDHLRIENIVIDLNETTIVNTMIDKMIELNGTYV